MADPETATFCFEYQRRVEFSDTDMAGVMHFSNFYRFMESAEHAFLHSLGLCPFERIDGKSIGWPRAQSSCDFLKPARFGDELAIRVSIEEVRSRSLRCRYRTYLKTGPKETLLADGRMTTVYASLDGQSGEINALEIPEPLREKLLAAQAGQTA